MNPCEGELSCGAVSPLDFVDVDGANSNEGGKLVIFSLMQDSVPRIGTTFHFSQKNRYTFKVRPKVTLPKVVALKPN